jgi:hypothetical protein
LTVHATVHSNGPKKRQKLHRMDGLDGQQRVETPLGWNITMLPISGISSKKSGPNSPHPRSDRPNRPNRPPPAKHLKKQGDLPDVPVDGSANDSLDRPPGPSTNDETSAPVEKPSELAKEPEQMMRDGHWPPPSLRAIIDDPDHGEKNT